MSEQQSRADKLGTVAIVLFACMMCSLEIYALYSDRAKAEKVDACYAADSAKDAEYWTCWRGQIDDLLADKPERTCIRHVPVDCGRLAK